MSSEELEPANDECFVVSPIGPEGSSVRRRADNVLNHVIRPAAKEVGLTALRADEIDAPGSITSQIIQKLLAAKAVVVDLTDRNPNVYYELAVRDSFKLPVVLIAEDGTERASDLLGQRTIFFNSSDLASAMGAISRITTALKEAIANPSAASPVQAAAQLGALAAGDAQQKVVAELAQEVALLRRDVEMSRQADAVGPVGRLAKRMAEEATRREREALAEAILLPLLPGGTTIHAQPDPADPVLILPREDLSDETEEAVLQEADVRGIRVEVINPGN